MARAPTAVPVSRQYAPAPKFDPKLKEEANDRLTDCRAQKAMVETDIRECYFFAAPKRDRAVSSQNSSAAKPTDAAELQITTGYEVAEDFLGMLVDSFMPEALPWAERKADPFFEKDLKKKVEEEAEKQDAKVFQLLKASNFYPELGKTGMPDAAIGVWAMHVHDPAPWRPVHCQGIPIRELEMNLGPHGGIDDRAVVRKTKYRHLAALLGGIPLPEEIQRKTEDKNGNGDCEIVWMYWRDWSINENEVWVHRVLVDGELVHDAPLAGRGSCPLIVSRFGSSPDFAWPDGPLIKSLPDLRKMDEMAAAFVENIDFTLRPPFGYPDDGVMNLSGGIEPGNGYPMRPGTREPFPKIWEPNPLEAALFDARDTERRIKRLHYVDFPEQPGKTPPTAQQWLDEMVKSQKRIGTPGQSFWREGPYETFQRFRYLAERRGIIVPIEVQGAPVTLHAYNPAQRAQENQDVLTAARFIQLGSAAFPQYWQVAVDPTKTLQNIKTKLGDELVALREPAEIQAAVAQLGALGGASGTQLPGGIAPAAGGAA